MTFGVHSVRFGRETNTVVYAGTTPGVDGGGRVGGQGAFDRHDRLSPRRRRLRRPRGRTRQGDGDGGQSVRRRNGDGRDRSDERR